MLRNVVFDEQGSNPNADWQEAYNQGATNGKACVIDHYYLIVYEGIRNLRPLTIINGKFASLHVPWGIELKVARFDKICKEGLIRKFGNKMMRELEQNSS